MTEDLRSIPLYENEHTHEKQLQILIERASQIELSDVPGQTRTTRLSLSISAATSD